MNGSQKIKITADPVLEQLRPYSKNNKIAIDIADDAVDNLSFDPDGIRAICYFEQQPTELFFPLSSLISLCAAENGRGIDFAGDDEQEDVLAYLASLEKLKAPPKTAHLQIVRSQNTEASDEN